MLIVFSSLPGAGKTTLARSIARHLRAAYVQVDTIEEAMLIDGGASLVDVGTGYRVAYEIAYDNLSLGRDVVVDCVNPIALTRQAWHDVGSGAATTVVDAVVVCTDPVEHKSRIDGRPRVARASHWQGIANRAFEPVDKVALVVDTAGRSVEHCLEVLVAELIMRSSQDQPCR